MMHGQQNVEFLLFTYNFIPLQFPMAYVNQIVMLVKVANGS